MDALLGVLGVLWYEATRVILRAARDEPRWIGLPGWLYGLCVAVFAAVAAVICLALDLGVLGSLFTGFAVEGGPHQTISAVARAQPSGSSRKIEEMNKAEAARAGPWRFLTWP